MISLFGALWRMWFGGSFGDCPRIFKHLVLVLSVFYLYSFDWQNWQMYAVALSFDLFWTKGHGDYFLVNDTGKDEARIKWIDWCLRQMFGVDGYYNFAGNCTGMMLRYSSYALLVSAALLNGWFMLSGFGVASIYGVCGKIFPDKWYTKYAEAVSGAFCFTLLFFCI